MSETVRRCNNGRSYALVTAAYNEEHHIERTILSVVNQTVLPAKWVIVSDGSTDRTDSIVLTYASQHTFIDLCRITEEHPRNLTAQVNAINTGFARLRLSDYSFIGNLDSDVSFAPRYFELLLEAFTHDPTLGLTGGYIYEEQNGEFRNRVGNTVSSVAHAVQLFRSECLESLGGYKAFSWAGADWHAEVTLRMKGWTVRSVPRLHVCHHRPTGRGFGALRYSYRGGIMDFYMGSNPLFELARIARRLRAKPYVIGGLVRLCGFASAYCRGERRQVSEEFMRFLRREQMQRLRLMFRRPFQKATHNTA